MAACKRKSTFVQSKRRKPLLASFTILFYICKVLGINSQEWKEFSKNKRLKKSPGGEVGVVIGTIISVINFNLMLIAYQSKTYVEQKSPLAIGIAVVLTYYSLFLLVSDRINALFKQQNFLNIFCELENIDEDLSDLNIVLNNNYIKYRLMIGIFLTMLIETMSFTLTFTMMVEKVNLTAFLWVYSSIPTLFNTLEKLWYVGILAAIRKRFEAINNAFDKEALNMERERLKKNKTKPAERIKNAKKAKRTHPANESIPAVFGDVITNSPTFSASFEGNIFSPPRISTTCSDPPSPIDTSYTSLENKFIKFCQLHDSLCSVAKQLNELFAFPNLILMGYGFFIITAHLCFFYSASIGQEIPTMFRPAHSWCITIIFIVYIFLKCVAILYGNWQAHLASKKSGICIHRCALAADNNETYAMINHLSLKLLNHRMEFNACGYFPLNMATLFSFCGGITTYLIILIQFNLEEHQAKSNNENMKPMARIQSVTPESFSTENEVNETHIETINLLSNVLYQTWNKYFNNV